MNLFLKQGQLKDPGNICIIISIMLCVLSGLAVSYQSSEPRIAITCSLVW
jgi:hypothetical protein